MLVLNRRPGESIVIEPDLRVTVLSVTDRRVWIGMCADGADGDLRVSATVVSPNAARLEIVPMSSVQFVDDRVCLTMAGEEEPASGARAGLAVDRLPGERVEIGDDLWVAVASISKGNPTITFGGNAIGDEFSITLIRPAGSYVRLGVDAPNRRVYREELWDAVQASGDVWQGGRLPGPAASGSPQAELAEPRELEPPPTELPLPEPAVGAAMPADVAGSVTG
jgi:sRNA-binding carbon storage regulator CsrA